MNFESMEFNVIGHWSSGSRMSERYDRSVRANELLHRNTIIQKMVGAWAAVDSFCLPETVPGSGRIGKGPEGAPADVVDLMSSPPVLPPATGTLESSLAAESPVRRLRRVTPSILLSRRIRVCNDRTFGVM